jgi:hypothetical protein
VVTPEEYRKAILQVMNELARLRNKIADKSDQWQKINSRIIATRRINVDDLMLCLDMQDARSRYNGYHDAVRAFLGDAIMDELSRQFPEFGPLGLPEDFWTIIGNLAADYQSGKTYQ